MPTYSYWVRFVDDPDSEWFILSERYTGLTSVDVEEIRERLALYGPWAVEGQDFMFTLEG